MHIYRYKDGSKLTYSEISDEIGHFKYEGEHGCFAHSVIESIKMSLPIVDKLFNSLEHKKKAVMAMLDNSIEANMRGLK